MDKINVLAIFPEIEKKSISSFLSKRLSETGHESFINDLNIITSIAASVNWEEALLTSRMDAVCLPLNHISPNIPFDFNIFAIHSRKIPQKIILCKDACFDPAQDLKLKECCRIGVPDVLSSIQVKHLNSTISPIIHDAVDVSRFYTNSDEFDAILVNESEITENKNHEEYHYINLHQSEFLEEVGADKIAWVCHRESREVKKHVYDAFHDTSLVPMSNVERSISRHFNAQKNIVLKTFIYMDSRNFYHLKASLIDIEKGTYHEHKISQSTHFQLAEKMITVLDSFIKN
ncbi:MAG: hypothetical protein WAT79_07775 [Saprospiraceae bacterium]